MTVSEEKIGDKDKQIHARGARGKVSSGSILENFSVWVAFCTLRQA